MTDFVLQRVSVRCLILFLTIVWGSSHCAYAQGELEDERKVSAKAPEVFPVEFPEIPDTVATLDRSYIKVPPMRALGPARFPLWFTPSSARSIHGLSIGPVLSWPDANRWKKVNGVGVSVIGFGAAPILFYGPGAALFPLSQFGLLSDRDQNGTLEVAGPIDVDTVQAGKTSKVGGPARNSNFGTVVNGLLVSPGGTMTDRVRGVSASAYLGGAGQTDGIVVNGVWSLSGRHRGVLFGAFANVGRGVGLVAGGSVLSIEMTGVQTAVVNQSARLRGVQIGLYNFSGDLKGVQIGLLNRTPARTLPFLNWSFD